MLTLQLIRNNPPAKRNAVAGAIISDTLWGRTNDGEFYRHAQDGRF
jgi:hypothetical protein